MTQYIYLSHFIDNETPLYGGKKKIDIRPDNEIKKGKSSNTKICTFPNHAGTHIDFPNHFNNNGKTISNYAPGFWIFDHPFVLEYPAKQSEIVLLENELGSIPENTDFLVIKTGFQQFRGKKNYWHNNPGLHPQLASRLKKHCPDLKIVGFDFISLTSYQNRILGREAHKSFLIENNLLLVEDMDLSRTDKGLSKLICLPLLLNKIDGSPATIVGEIDMAKNRRLKS